MYLQVTDKYWVIDIEGDPIPSTRVWCLCAQNCRTGEEVALTDYGEIKDWFASRKEEGCKFIGHNIIGYDAPTLNRIAGTSLTISDIIDTMLMSMLYSPSLDGGHSLDAWGKRLRYRKIDFNDFSKFTPEMLEYCKKDVYLCRKVYAELVKRMRKLEYTDVGLEIEHRSWQLLQKQHKVGFAFNIAEAHVLLATLRELQNKIRDEIYKYWPPEVKLVETYKKPFKKDGSYTANYERHVEQFLDVKISNNGEEYHCFDYVAFNIASPEQRVAKLLELGWVPREFTKKTPKGGGGNPQPTTKGQLSPSLQEFVDENNRPEPKLIAQWIEIYSRATMVNTWMEAYNEKTKAIHGRVWLANTLRLRHSEPNTANIPAVRLYEDENKEEHPLLGRDGVYTYEARDLWTTHDPKTRKLVGVDAKGIQLRVLAHYLNNPEFTKAVLDGDPHSYNQEIGGFRSRPIAKTFIYAFLLGAGDEKVGQIIGGTTRDGRETKRRFIGNFPGLGDLLDDLERQVDATGRIRLCDGTPLIVTAPHTRLGYLLQGDESRIMKKASIIMDLEVRKRRLDAWKVGDIHDEWQNDVLNRDVEEFAYGVCPYAFDQAGKFFNYRLPIACDAKIGLTWAETH